MSLDHYKAQFDSFISTIYDETEAVLEARRNAFNNFIKLGLPSKKLELWQYTDLSALTKTRFDIPKSSKPSIDILKIENISIPNCNKIVIVNGIKNLNKDMVFVVISFISYIIIMKIIRTMFSNVEDVMNVN